MLLGTPGLIVSALAFLTLRRPPRPDADSVLASSAPAASLRNTLADLASRKSFVHVTIGLAISAIGAYGLATWEPAFFMRTFAASATKIGGLSAVVSGPAAMLGIVLGGFFGDRLSKKDPRWPVWLFIIGLGGVSPIYLLILLSTNLTLSMILAVPAGIIASLWIAPGYALIQNLAGPQSRATAAASSWPPMVRTPVPSRPT